MNDTRLIAVNHLLKYLPTKTTHRFTSTQGEVTSQSLWSRYDHHFVDITRYNALS